MILRVILAMTCLAGPLAGRGEFAPATQPAFNQVTGAREWSFPKDHGRHDGFKTEWWYFTGNLREKSTGRKFGYQLTFFRSSLIPSQPTPPTPGAPMTSTSPTPPTSTAPANASSTPTRSSPARPSPPPPPTPPPPPPASPAAVPTSPPPPTAPWTSS